MHPFKIVYKRDQTPCRILPPLTILLFFLPPISHRGLPHFVSWVLWYSSHNSQGLGFPGGPFGKESACSLGERPTFDLWVRKIPWRREWQPTPVFLPGESHRQRRFAGYIPWGSKESDTTEWLIHTHRHKQNEEPPRFIFKGCLLI